MSFFIAVLTREKEADHFGQPPFVFQKIEELLYKVFTRRTA